MTAADTAHAERARAEAKQMLRRGLLLFVGFAGLSVIVFASAIGSWSVLGVAMILAAGSFMAGGLLGFLFGIPQSLTSADSAIEAETGRTGFRSNTNLEQISDWFTKILVGAGLVGLTSLIHEMGNLVDWLAPALGNEPGSPAFALGLLVFCAVCGFLLLYLTTSITLGPVLVRMDTLMRYVEERFERVEVTIEKAEETRREQEEHDVSALALVNRQLEPEAGAVSPEQEALDDAVASASPLVRAQIFARARDQRRRRQFQGGDDAQATLARTIPVFRALIAADPEQQYHRSHGQLGFALKDKEPPDWIEAEAALTQAIEIRDRNETTGGFLLYEFNRAICRINTAPQSRDAILGDLRAASKSNYLKKTILMQDPSRTWLADNDLTAEDLDE